MHIVIRQYEVEPDAVEEISRRVRDGFAPYVSQVLPGFVEYYWIKASDGSLVSLSIFEDEAVALASTKVAAGYVRDHLGTANLKPPKVLEGEVFARIVGPATQGGKH